MKFCHQKKCAENLVELEIFSKWFSAIKIKIFLKLKILPLLLKAFLVLFTNQVISKLLYLRSKDLLKILDFAFSKSILL